MRSTRSINPSRPVSCRNSHMTSSASLVRLRSALGYPSELEALKSKLLQRALRTFCESHFELPLRQAAERAARLALDTGYPLLVFPELFCELAIPAMARTEFRVLAWNSITQSLAVASSLRSL
jgi:hypothetical protein